ncbi:class I SAM-dependent methyltransferase [Pseudomonas sp. N040]|uniref:class I SAM-dependent methyltransferase n=1 Tax=Pseudomonas sp. N040 TaxID=2785325 RepID=UPI0018A2AC55|nr:class I SAM-dependent methyltransferase [Pseudomonas sp. N040]MBF7730502.1 class I SAM-dependent methyltransferase [Pseudomonas sp. N040]MBW7014146.1 class I SAM-dependent methyltransferase [Pseudomonas sp. N040]
MTNSDEIETQRRYYAETASRYDSMHLDENDEHFFALSFMVGVIDYLGIQSILDIGSGTGRAVQFLKKIRPDLRVVGVEPVTELREIGYLKGLSTDELIDGDAKSLDFKSAEFDLVCEFGVLHHIKEPCLAVAEMLRVSNKAIFISDSNNFGQGSILARKIKQFINFVGLWKVADLIKTRGKGYTISEGDGLAYSYSVFNNYRQIQSFCKSVHILNTKDGLIDPYKTASHVALLGIKKQVVQQGAEPDSSLLRR